MIGSFMGTVFTVSNEQILTVKNLKGKTAGDWATHDVIGAKSRSQFMGPKLRSYKFDILLRAQDGVNPRQTLETLQDAAETGKTDWFIIGEKPLSQNQFRITDLTDEWAAVLQGGKLIECKVGISIEEYA